MKKIILIALLAMVLVLTLVFTACGNQKITEKDTSDKVHVSVATDEREGSATHKEIEEPKAAVTHTSIYSWDRQLLESEPLDVFAKMSDYNISRCYQGLYPADLTETYDATAQMVRKLRSLDIEPVYLVNGAEWNAPEIAKAWSVDLLSTYNSHVSKDAQIYSIAFDNEFYQENDSVEGFREYANNMKILCEYAQNKGYNVINILPYWIPEKYSEDILKKVLGFSDEISVMCYCRESEIENLKLIYDLCTAAGVSVECVFETQAPRGEEIKEINTYYNKGKDAVIAAAESVRTAYPDISVGYHALTNMLDWK